MYTEPFAHDVSSPSIQSSPARDMWRGTRLAQAPQAQPLDVTTFVVYRGSLTSYGYITGSGTVPLATQEDRSAAPPAPVVDVAAQANQVSQNREARLNLLVRKYEGQWSDENEARFQILTERVRRAEPRVTAEDFASAEAALDQIEAISARFEDIQRHLLSR